MVIQFTDIYTHHNEVFFLNFPSTDPTLTLLMVKLEYSRSTGSIALLLMPLRFQLISNHGIDGLAQDCSNSSANALELLQFCTNPSVWTMQGGQVHVFTRKDFNNLHHTTVGKWQKM